MDVLNAISWPLLILALTTLLVFCSYPLFVFFLFLIAKKEHKPNKQINTLPLLTLFIVVRNGEALIAAKILNCLALNYPEEKLQILIVSDGSTDNSIAIIQSMLSERVVFFNQPEHYGKSQAINHFIHQSSGDIVVFSDVDALLDSEALLQLTAHFNQANVGGVCGQRLIKKDLTKLTDSQKSYIKYDSLIKKFESASGSITSNDGKLFAIRKALFCPIEEGVTDDMFIMLGVVKKFQRFIFEPAALAYIRTPSRSFTHEIERRKRITSGSLAGMQYNKALFNPFEYGVYSVKLLINKVVRRLMPVLMLVILFASLTLSFSNDFIAAFFLSQIAFYLLALNHPIMLRYLKKHNPLLQASGLVCYFCLGNYGQLLGLINYAKNKAVTKWDPLKDDARVE